MSPTPEDDIAIYCAANNVSAPAAMTPTDHIWAIDLSQDTGEPLRARYQNGRGAAEIEEAVP